MGKKGKGKGGSKKLKVHGAHLGHKAHMKHTRRKHARRKKA